MNARMTAAGVPVNRSRSGKGPRTKKARDRQLAAVLRTQALNRGRDGSA